MAVPAFVCTEYAPSPALRPYVCSYGHFVSASAHPVGGLRPDFNGRGRRGVFYECDPLVELAPPSGHLTLCFNLGDPFTFSNGFGRSELRGSGHLTGALSRRAKMELGRRVELFGVVFRPGRARAFLGFPTDLVTDRFTPLEDLWGREGRALELELQEIPTLAGKIRRLEQALLRRLSRAPSSDAGLEAMLDFIGRRRGPISVEWLSGASGISRQHLARKFRQTVGIGPKFFCRVVRFQAMLGEAYRRPLNWAAAAADYGYYDQAHLISEFKEFTGLTPGQFFRPLFHASAIAAD